MINKEEIKIEVKEITNEEEIKNLIDYIGDVICDNFNIDYKFTKEKLIEIAEKEDFLNLRYDYIVSNVVIDYLLLNKEKYTTLLDLDNKIQYVLNSENCIFCGDGDDDNYVYYTKVKFPENEIEEIEEEFTEEYEFWVEYQFLEELDYENEDFDYTKVIARIKDISLL